MLSGPALERNVIEVNALNESGLTALDVSSRSDREIRNILMRAENSPSSEIVLVDCQKDDVKADISFGSLVQGAVKIFFPPEGSNQGQDTSNLPKGSNQGQDTSNLPKGSNQGQDTTVNPRDTLLVVATLIASATYQAVLQPPSFTPKADTSTKKGFLAVYASFMTSAIMRDLNYLSFMSGNTFGFLVSVQMIICLTRKLPLRSPVLLATSAMVYTYFCYMWYMPFSDALGEKFSLMSVELLAVLPIVISFSLLLLQKIIALGLKFFILGISRITMPSDMYSLNKSSDHSDSIFLGLAKKSFDFFAKKVLEVFAKKGRQ